MNIFNDPMALQQMQQMGINPYQFQAFLQSPQGQQVAQECNQYTMSKFGEYVQSLNQNFGQQGQMVQQGQMGKHNAPNEEMEQIMVQNQELQAQLEKSNEVLARMEEMLNTKEKGGKNGNKQSNKATNE